MQVKLDALPIFSVTSHASSWHILLRRIRAESLTDTTIKAPNMVGRRVVMNMGAVAGSVGRIRQDVRSRSTRQGGAEPTSPGGTNSLDDSADVLKAQIIEIEKIRSSKAFHIAKDITSPDLNEDERLLFKSNVLKGLIALLKSRIDIKYSYLRLLGMLLFFSLYSTTVIIQRNIFDSFGVQSR